MLAGRGSRCGDPGPGRLGLSTVSVRTASLRSPRPPGVDVRVPEGGEHDCRPQGRLFVPRKGEADRRGVRSLCWAISQSGPGPPRVTPHPQSTSLTAGHTSGPPVRSPPCPGLVRRSWRSALSRQAQCCTSSEGAQHPPRPGPGRRCRDQDHSRHAPGCSRSPRTQTAQVPGAAPELRGHRPDRWRRCLVTERRGHERTHVQRDLRRRGSTRPRASAPGYS